MVHPLSERALGASNLTAKNRVWGFFGNSNSTRPANRREPMKLLRKNRPTLTKTASGIPYWPSREPIEEKGGINLYGFVNNDGVNQWDYLGLCVIYGVCELSSSTANFWGGGSCEYFCYETDRKPRVQGNSSFLGIDVSCNDTPAPHTWTESEKPNKKFCIGGDGACRQSFDSATRVKEINWGGCSRADCKLGCAYIMSGALAKGIARIIAQQAYQVCVDTCNSSCKNP
jgi:hypothetical protein